MIGAEGLRRGGPEEEMIRLAQQGKIETILSQKEPIELHNLFPLPAQTLPPLVVLPPPPPGRVCLIEGAPGGGKSTLALHICHQWAQGASWLERFNVVVLAYLRDEAIQNANTLADILPAKESPSQFIIPQLQASCGDGVLFVFDGWDEFPHHLMDKSLVSTIIYQPQKFSLHRSTVLITSRPVSSGNLLHIADRRIEILGFTQHQIREYIRNALDGNSTLIQKLVQHLEDHPVVEGYCYIPLHSAILVHIFLTMKGALPATLHELFCSLVLCCIIREQATHEPDKPLPEISSLDDFPDDLKTTLSKLCVLAYNGVMQDKIVFYSKDLQSSHVPINLSSLGLLQAVEGLTLYSKSISYNFLHLSVQELLAAYSISLMDPSEQVKVFKKLFDSSRLEAVLQYYSGFTKLKNPGIQQFISSYQCRKSHLTDLLPLLYCLYETQQPSLCQLVDPRFDPDKLNCNLLTPVNQLMIGYFITSILSTTTSRMSCVSLSYKSAKDQHGLKALLSELSKYPVGRVSAMSRKVTLNVSGISEQEAKHIASHFKQSPAISNLRMTDCDGDGVLHILEALQAKMSSLNELYLINSFPEHTEQASAAFSKTLQIIIESLTHLDLSYNPSVNQMIPCIFQELKHNTALLHLNLRQTGITDEDAEYICQALKSNCTLQTLDIRNASLFDEGTFLILDSLMFNTTLKKLLVYINMDKVNKFHRARSKKGLPPVDIFLC